MEWNGMEWNGMECRSSTGISYVQNLALKPLAASLEQQEVIGIHCFRPIDTSYF
jgi:hypothetical protein